MHVHLNSDYTVNVIIKTIIFGFFCYLIGSIPNGYWIGKFFFKKDITKEGSGNIGATNALRVLGTTTGILVAIMDILKGAIATWLPVWFGVYTLSPLIFGLLAVLGHTYSIFLHFQGGQAVATSAGILLAYNFPLFIFCVSIFILTLLISSMASLASILMAFSAVIYCFLLTNDLLKVFAVAVTVIIIYTHKNNIIRIFKGNERLIKFGIYYWFLKKRNCQNKKSQ